MSPEWTCERMVGATGFVPIPNEDPVSVADDSSASLLI
jgi:hypothetical protein